MNFDSGKLLEFAERRIGRLEADNAELRRELASAKLCFESSLN